MEFQILPGTEDGERIALKGEGDEMVRISCLSDRRIGCASKQTADSPGSPTYRLAT